MTPSQQEAAERRVLRRYERLHKDLIGLVDALYKTEPTGNWIEKVSFKTKKDGKVQVGYRVRPTELLIEDGQRRFKLKLEELPKKKSNGD